MGAPLLRGPRLSLLLLLLQPHQHHCRRWFLLRLPVQGLRPLLPLPPSSCRLNHRPPPAPHRPFPSVSLQYLRIPNPQVRGYWVSPLPRRSLCVHDKPIRIRWLTSVRLPDAIHQMLILYTTQESPHSMLLGVQGPLDMVLLCTIVLTPISAALLLMLGISQAVGVMSEKCIWESALRALTVQSSYTTMEVDGASTCAQSTPLFPGILPRSKPHLWHPPTL